MTDPYYAQYEYYQKKPILNETSVYTPKPKNPLKYLDSDSHLLNTSYLPTSDDSLTSMIYDTRTYGLDISDLIMQDKQRLLGATAQLFQQKINQRSTIREKSLSILDEKVLQCEKYLVEIEHIPPFINPLVESKRANLGHSLQQLESEKIRETINCWGDQLRLYTDLINTLGEYQRLTRRSQLLDGDDEC